MEIASARRAWWAVVLVAGVLAGCHRRPAKGPLPQPPAGAADPAARLTGRVVDGGGHAVPDAVVLAFPLGTTSPAGQPTS
ncbi:MAG: hypothetical protein ABUS79_28030, partial [Pseudomonadota bacterium]